MSYNRRYLNKADRSNILLIAFLGLAATHAKDNLSNDYFDVASKRKLSTIITYAQNIFEYIVNNKIPQNQLKSMMNALRSNELEIVPKTAKHRPIQEDEARENMYTIVAAAMEGSCVNCQQGEEFVANCELRDIYMLMGVPLARHDCNCNECPYTLKEIR